MMKLPKILTSRLGRGTLAAVAATVVAIAVPTAAGAVTSTSCANQNLDNPRAYGAIRVFAAGYPGVYCYLKGTGQWTGVDITQVYEVDGASYGVSIFYQDSSGWHQDYIGPNEYRLFPPWGGAGVHLTEMA